MSQMQTYISGDTISTTVRMCRTAQPTKRPVILVEGSTDHRIYTWTLREFADIVPGSGKEKVLNAANVLAKDQTTSEWFLVIVDADFDHIRGIKHDSIVLVTDLHDIECEYLNSPALEKILVELGSESRFKRAFSEKVAKDLAALAASVREAILKSAKVIGVLRLISITNGYNLSFKQMNHMKILTEHTIDVDRNKLLRIILAAGANVTIEPKALRKELDSECKKTFDPWQICQGHDLVKVFSLGMRRLWGDRNVAEQDIERNLRLGYEAAYFWNTALGKRLKERLEELGVDIGGTQ